MYKTHYYQSAIVIVGFLLSLYFLLPFNQRFQPVTDFRSRILRNIRHLCLSHFLHIFRFV